MSPDGWREVMPTNRTHRADEDLDYAEFFGVAVGELIDGPLPFVSMSC
jgi:hypothetical protein